MGRADDGLRCGIPYTAAWVAEPLSPWYARGLRTGGGRTHRADFHRDHAGAAPAGVLFKFPYSELDVATDDPMMASMAGRYAAALFQLAKDQRQTAEVERDVVAFQAMLDASDDLRRLVRSPVISAEDQGRALGAVLEKAGISGLTANFVRLIARNRRLFAVADMFKGFRALTARERGEVSAEVATAHALTPEQLQLLSDTLRAQVGKNVQINTRVDPSLLGGLIVKIGSRMIDSSLRTKLDNLKVAMKGIA
jgi:F-type H+-transporting ATPase subunit delta